MTEILSLVLKHDFEDLQKHEDFEKLVLFLYNLMKNLVKKE